MSEDFPQQLECLLSDLHRRGHLDSSGRFTVDWNRGLEKFRKAQLADPEDYVLKFVQAAVAGGAKRIDITVRGRDVRLEFDGAGYSPEQLEEIHSYLLRPADFSETRHLVYLACAVGSATRLAPEVLLVESCHPGGSAILLLEPERSYAGPLKDHPETTGNRIHIRRPAAGAEQDRLRGRCSLAGTAIRLNGHALTPGSVGRPDLPPAVKPLTQFLSRFGSINDWFEGNKDRAHLPRLPWWLLMWQLDDYIFGACHRHHHLFERCLVADPHPELLAVSPASQASIREIVTRRLSAPPQGRSDGDGLDALYCDALLAIGAELGRENHLWFIKDGVVIDHKQEDLGVRGAIGWVSAHRLKTDLSGFSLVQNEDYQELVTRVAEEFEEMLQQLKARIQEVPLSEYFAGRLRRRG